MVAFRSSRPKSNRYIECVADKARESEGSLGVSHPEHHPSHSQPESLSLPPSEGTVLCASTDDDEPAATLLRAKRRASRINSKHRLGCGSADLGIVAV
eukprot:164574-Rhodomonas_salina.1